MMLIYAGVVLFTALVTVPNWPLFNRHPLKWLDPTEADKYPKPEGEEEVEEPLLGFWKLFDMAMVFSNIDQLSLNSQTLTWIHPFHVLRDLLNCKPWWKKSFVGF